MKYNRFEELPVWKAAIEFGVRVYALTVNPRFKGFYSLKDQLERAAVSYQIILPRDLNAVRLLNY